MRPSERPDAGRSEGRCPVHRQPHHTDTRMYIVAYIVLPLLQERWRAFPTEEEAERFAVTLDNVTGITFHVSDEEQ